MLPKWRIGEPHRISTTPKPHSIDSSWTPNNPLLQLLANLSNRLRRNLRLVLTIIVILAIYLFISHSSDHDFRTGRSRSKFTILTRELLPPPSPPPRPAYLPPPLKPKKKGMVVPNSLHYIYGLKPLPEGNKGEELPYYAYLAIRSAQIHLQPQRTYFHYINLPTGPWWDILESSFTLIRTQAPDTIMGNNITHFAHKADVLRLLAMRHSGGVYLDIDMFITRSFDDLMYFPTTLGMESATDSSRSPLDPEGLCNAVIISQPHAPFIDRWIASYETFSKENWAGHSVVKPWEIARRYPDEIQVLSQRAFFWPMWYGEEIQYTHENDDYDFYKSGQYAYHSWESLAMKYLEKLSPRSIREEDNSFNRMVRPFVGPDDDEVYDNWIRNHRVNGH